ncbi:uncharacterized protein LOC112568526 [Pomacea canaliculata]|uniref:uncharacterized protein LOC112568526 n=1 Tax=Pomacea canaliculata TaxID=400727 RepID=UPI000D73A929|nr:uncharacterized protein LOC112568526 [Pomacea canaliculata]
MINNFEGLYTARITDIHKTTMIIKPENSKKVYDDVELVNGRLECSNEDDLAGCGLNLVDPPANVSCKATNSSWSINVSCVIGSVYSSRKIYTCSLIRTQASKNETLENVTMVTSQTSEKITKSEVKVSGFCHFNTTLPTEEGHYGFIVSFSPGARNCMTDNKQFTVERPRSPAASCGPQPYVLEHTTLTCTCYTSSLGQPEGYLRWVSGNQTNQGTVVKQQQLPSKELRYNLTLSDHNNTWFRCDVFWGTEEIQGENYTASVGYLPTIKRLAVNGDEKNQTVKEGDQVKITCESESRPTPNVFIRNIDNDTVVVNDSSHLNYTFIARCKDTATYQCSASNELSPQSDVTTSPRIMIDVNCKPRSFSSTLLGTVKSGSEIQELRFDVIAYPAPHRYEAWLVSKVINNSEPSFRDVQGSELNVTCEASKQYRYLSKCSLTIIGISSRSDDFYKVQVINEHGGENFTVEISDVAPGDSKFYNLAVIYGVVCLIAIIFVSAVLIVVIRKLKKSKGDQSSQTPGETHQTPLDSADTSGLVPCQMPVYAVVDKTRKKTACQPEYIAEAADEREEGRRNAAQGVSVSNSRLPDNTESEYAVLEMSRGKTSARHDKDYKHKKQEFRTNAMQGILADDDDFKIYDHLTTQPLSPQQDCNTRRDIPCPASHSHAEDDGSWATDDLMYLTSSCDVSYDAKRPPPPRPKERKY